jgi:CDP-glycerol glycerophosphotransferase
MKNIKYCIFCFLYILLSPFFKIRKRILFVCFNFTQYSDSQRAICEKMHVLYPDYELIWLYRPNPKIKIELFPKYVKFLKYSYFKFIKYLSSSFCVINNFEYTREFKKKKRQFFIQTYHGDKYFKKVLFDCDPQHKNIMDNKVVDLGISGSNFSEKRLYQLSLHYKGPILKEGMPRNDSLVKNEISREKILKELSLTNDKKIILFAPTFRDSADGFFHNYLNFNQVLSLFNEDYVICYRLHKSSLKCDIVPNERIINVSDYYDVSNLLGVADVLITDYSSCACDFALTGRPVVLALFDYEDYVSNSRGLCVDIKTIGFKCAHNMDELLNVLSNTSIQDFENCDLSVLNNYGSRETGESSQKICEIINNNYVRYFEKHE